MNLLTSLVMVCKNLFCLS